MKKNLCNLFGAVLLSIILTACNSNTDIFYSVGETFSWTLNGKEKYDITYLEANVDKIVLKFEKLFDEASFIGFSKVGDYFDNVTINGEFIEWYDYGFVIPGIYYIAYDVPKISIFEFYLRDYTNNNTYDFLFYTITLINPYKINNWSISDGIEIDLK